MSLLTELQPGKHIQLFGRSPVGKLPLVSWILSTFTYSEWNQLYVSSYPGGAEVPRKREGHCLNAALSGTVILFLPSASFRYPVPLIYLDAQFIPRGADSMVLLMESIV